MPQLMNVPPALSVPQIIQAPMAGGPTTPALVAAVAEAGALGGLGAAYLTPAQIAADCAEIRRRTDRPFAVNLFVPPAVPPSWTDPEAIQRARALLVPFRRELGLPDFEDAPPAPPPDFDAQLDAILAAGAPVLSFTFGLPSGSARERMLAAGRPWIGTATSAREAVANREAGAAAVVAQGYEAGGHRGTFLETFEDGMVGTMALVPAVVDALGGRIPTLAAGGIADARGVAAARTLGAAGAVVGTAFLLCREAGTSAPHRAALLNARETDTTITRVMSGRPARGLRNRLTEELRAHLADLAPFPVQNALTAELRRIAARTNRPEFMAMWSGQDAPLLRRWVGREPTAAEMVSELEGRRQTADGDSDVLAPAGAAEP